MLLRRPVDGGRNCILSSWTVTVTAALQLQLQDRAGTRRSFYDAEVDPQGLAPALSDRCGRSSLAVGPPKLALSAASSLGSHKSILCQQPAVAACLPAEHTSLRPWPLPLGLGGSGSWQVQQQARRVPGELVLCSTVLLVCHIDNSLWHHEPPEPWRHRRIASERVAASSNLPFLCIITVEVSGLQRCRASAQREPGPRPCRV